jgi:anti-sigma regulatory factor (Ser/Thr protein kinase)
MSAENDTQEPYEQRQWFCRLDDDPEAVVTARTLAATVLKGWDTELVQDAVLVTSELVTNAIAHGSVPVTLTVTVRTEPEPAVIIDVADASPDLPVPDLPGEVGHFGLWIAEELARVTVHTTSCGKTVRAIFTLFGTQPGHEACSTSESKPRWSRSTCAEDGDVVTRRDGEGLYIATERHDRQREETADVTTRLFTAVVSSDEGARAVLLALPQMFSWVRHLSSAEVHEFVVDLVNAIRDATELDVHSNLHRVVVEWRATAWILADPGLTAQLTASFPDEGHGEVPAPLA